MTGIQVTAATPAQRAKAIEALVVGFAANPTCRWIWPDLGQYMTAMPQLIEALAGRAFDNGTAYVDQDVRGAALWLAPDTEPDQEAIAALIERTIDPVRLEDVGLLFAKLEQYHPQNEPCWYLPFIAVEPFSQNKGIGDALMRHALARHGGDGLPFYLESSDPRNLTLYQRLGFEIMGRIEVGAFKSVHPMIRQA